MNSTALDGIGKDTLARMVWWAVPREARQLLIQVVTQYPGTGYGPTTDDLARACPTLPPSMVLPALHTLLRHGLVNHTQSAADPVRRWLPTTPACALVQALADEWVAPPVDTETEGEPMPDFRTVCWKLLDPFSRLVFARLWSLLTPYGETAPHPDAGATTDRLKAAMPNPAAVDSDSLLRVLVPLQGAGLLTATQTADGVLWGIDKAGAELFTHAWTLRLDGVLL